MPPRDASGLTPSVVAAWCRRVDAGALRRDPLQLGVAAALDRVAGAIAKRPGAQKSGALGWLFGSRESADPVRGLYIHGGVGRGKTMLMDLFFEILPVKAKRRAHFNAFMADVHDRITRHRQAVKDGTAKGDDPIPPVAAALAEKATVLCFDEFAVNDIADAMILSRLFTALFAAGVVLVATSNVAPDDLYRDGLNRALFLPFIDMLKAHADILPLDGPTDYRLQKLKRMPVYLTPDDDEAGRVMDEAWAAASAGLTDRPATVEVLGRRIAVQHAAGRAARFDFADLCRKPLAARDYLAIADRFEMIFVDHIPVIDAAERNEAKRFILLIDTLYDRRIRLVASAAAPPSELYPDGKGAEAFEFARTSSRLVEMQDAGWPPPTSS